MRCSVELVGLALVVAGLPWAAVQAGEGADRQTLEFTKWSGEVNVPDPVAISLDPQGRAYVTQTRRRKVQDLDIRQNRDWIPHDVSFQTIEDKRRFYHQQLPIGGDNEAAARRVDDMNGDGAHDWRDLTAISEKIHRIEDTDGDGTADRIELFADGFQTEVTGIAAGVLWHDGAVYTTIAPDVWRLRDNDADGRSDEREVIAHGFGVHIAYAGHDMHGLTVGPDGKIYWSIGDKGISVTTPDGQRFLYPNQGGVLRCNPDGSDFEVFAHGLRNVQEIAFDAEGNLFGVDNDADGPGEKERFVFIVPEMDAGWRCNYQYLQDHSPWWDEGLWKTETEDTPAYLIPPIRHYIDGPAGFAFNPGTALSPAYRDYFFLTGAPNGFQYAFRAEPDGASFRMVDEHQIGQGVPLVGINFGPDGALYGVDWGGGYPLTETGAVWKIDAPRFAESPERLEVQRLLEVGFRETDGAALLALLDHADRRIRLGAQFELVRRQRTEALQRAASNDSQGRLARTHAIWGLGQLARGGDARAVRRIAELLEDPAAKIRLQAARTARDLRSINGGRLIPLMADSDPQVRLHAALAAARHPTPKLFDAAVRLLSADAAADAYLRHAGITALAAAESVSGTELAARLADHEGTVVRQAAVVALRRRSDPAVAIFLNDPSEAVVAEAARAIHDDWSIAAAMPDLADWLQQPTATSEVILRRAINANFRLGAGDHATRLGQFAARDDQPAAMRADALRALAAWTDPPPLDRVDGRRRELDAASRSFDSQRLRQSLTAVLREGQGELPTLAVMAMRSLGLEIDAPALRRIVAGAGLPAELRVEALRGLADDEDTEGVRAAIEDALSSQSAALRKAGLRTLASRDAAAATVVALHWLDNRDAPTAQQQLAMKLLGTLPTDAASERLREELGHLVDGDSVPALRLELLAAARAKATEDSAIAEALDRAERQPTAGFLAPSLAEFEASLWGGDAAAGERLFKRHLSAQCSRCHKIGGEGSEVGPDLKGIAEKRDRKHLLRAVVDPSADIEADYLSRTVLLFSGQVIQGIVQSETDDEIVLVDNRGQEVRVPQDEIEAEREQRVSIMPTMTDVLTPEQIRDLVAFLATLK